MRAINLLPPDEQRPGLERARLPLLAAAGGAALVVLAGGFLHLSASADADELRAEIEAIELRVASLPQPPDLAVSQGALVQERNDRVTALSAALAGRIPFDRVFREISYVLPKDAWLTGLSAAAPARAEPDAPPGTQAPTPGAGVDDVTIQGSAYSHDGVARVLSRLAAAPSLANVRLVSSTRAELEPPAGPARKKSRKRTAFVTFTIAASLRSGGQS